jgi:tetratricopeptide (TPR) repeat protein
MNRRRSRLGMFRGAVRAVTGLVLVVLAATANAAPQDGLAAARELYTTAAYEEALAMLDRLREKAPAGPDVREIHRYRAFALHALGRAAEAEQAVEALVAIDPTFELADAEAPPRLVTLFSSVRERALPGIVKKRFDAAKALYNAKRHENAVEAFSSLILLLEHPAVAKAAGPGLAEMKTVASGFRDLSKASAEQARLAAEQAETAKVLAAQKAAQTPEPAAAAAPAPAPPAPVLPPSIISQAVPRPTGVALPADGNAVIVLDVLINELGQVERATVRQSVNRPYEVQLLAAARGWRYTPATQAGKPVKYVKTLEITLTPR